MNNTMHDFTADLPSKTMNDGSHQARTIPSHARHHHNECGYSQTNISRPSPHAQYNQGAPTPPATLILRQLIPSASRRTIGLGERLTQTHLPGVIRLRKQSADIP